MPAEIEVIKLIRRNRTGMDAALGQRLVQVFPVQYVKPHKRPAATAYLFHGRRVLTSPRICKLECVNG
jgi:hypothetical protein